jgi:hypothetical protein
MCPSCWIHGVFPFEASAKNVLRHAGQSRARRVLKLQRVLLCALLNCVTGAFAEQ